eukprot:1156034-Pelagomonas_calceolata.AAC.1
MAHTLPSIQYHEGLGVPLVDFVKLLYSPKYNSRANNEEHAQLIAAKKQTKRLVQEYPDIFPLQTRTGSNKQERWLNSADGYFTVLGRVSKNMGSNDRWDNDIILTHASPSSMLQPFWKTGAHYIKSGFPTAFHLKSRMGLVTGLDWMMKNVFALYQLHASPMCKALFHYLASMAPGQGMSALFNALRRMSSLLCSFRLVLTTASAGTSCQVMVLIRYYNCQFGQVPEWAYNGKRAGPIQREGKCQLRGHMSQRHGCAASITVTMDRQYAISLGFCKKRDQGELQPERSPKPNTPAEVDVPALLS